MSKIKKMNESLKKKAAKSSDSQTEKKNVMTLEDLENIHLGIELKNNGIKFENHDVQLGHNAVALAIACQHSENLRWLIKFAATLIDTGEDIMEKVVEIPQEKKAEALKDSNYWVQIVNDLFKFRAGEDINGKPDSK